MPTAEYELAYLRAGIQLLESYLVSKELYWSIPATPPGGGGPFPQLTPGSLLLAQARLHARHLAEPLLTELAVVDQELLDLQYSWRVAWERKCAHDFSARLKLWRDFLEEVRSNPENHADRYAYEVRRRVMLELISPFVDFESPAERELLAGLDRLLSALSENGNFIWESDLAAGFPRDRFWYLYGSIRG